jgi:hypothetical protein
MRSIAGWSQMSFGGGQGSPSNGDLAAVTFKKPNNDWGVAVVDLRSSPVRVVSERVFGNSSSSLGSLIDNAGISQTGDYVVVCFTPDGTSSTTGVWIFRRDLSTQVQVLRQEEHWDWARNRSGQDVLVYRADSGTRAYNVSQQRDYLLVSGLESYVHASGRNVKRPGWVYLSSYNVGRTTPGYGIVFAVDLDDPSKVQIYAHHYHSNSLGYVSEVHASPSPDGKYVVFASEWGGSAVHAYIAHG